MDAELARNQLVRTGEIAWKPLREPGVTGISVKVLRFDETARRAPTILLKFDPGASCRAGSLISTLRALSE